MRHDANYRDNAESVKQLCRDSAPLIQLFQYKEKYKQQLIKKLLNEDLKQALPGKRLRHSRSVHFPEDPQFSKTYAHHSSALNWTRRGFVNKFSNATPPSYPFRARRGFAAFIPALTSLATIAVESIGFFLQKKRDAALAKGITTIQSDQSLAWNSTRQLEDDFLLYGKYNLDSLKKIIHTVNHLGGRVHQLEEILLGKDHSLAKRQFVHTSVLGRILFAHKLNVYLTSVQETKLRLYDELEHVLREFLSAVGTLGKGYLPASLFPPTVLLRITSGALKMVQRMNPDYVLTIQHVTEYYDMKMVTFGVNDGDDLLVAFPVFVQDP